ncbi:restriction endonuclease subunit S [Spiroplasma sp. SV19]|uniref:restriction endonuclease subunit S n=1 Tax=Spiroplasma sp. SV19 TaxID=2570468 RepID=UPI0024B7B2E9|nr:restriction endonuclease subunit S [Spiroplasma sp. SV19]WHQ37495.1 hypothetical protein E7Y35_06585 [Spiroplasma sp. SV19]
MAIIKTLSEIVISRKGEIDHKKNFSKHYLQGYYPIVSAGKNIKGYYKFKNREKEILCISSSGINAGFISIPKTDFFAADCFTLEVKNKHEILQKYLNYKILSIKKNIISVREGSAQPHVYFKNIADIKIEVPNIDEQKSIIDIIEKFGDEKFKKYSNLIRIDSKKTVKRY